MQIECPNCKEIVIIPDEKAKTHYNWKCENCDLFIKLKGNFLPVWKCNKGT